MKNKLTITLFLFCACISDCYSQSFWQAMPGPQGGYCNQFVRDGNGNLLVAMSTFQFNLEGLLKTTNQGSSWQYLRDKDVYAVATNGANGFIAYEDFWGNVISTNGGVNWTQINSNVTGAGTIYSYLWTPEGSIFAGGNGVNLYKTTNNGSIWSNVLNAPESFFAICRDSAGSIFAGTHNGKIYKSTNGGNNFQSFYHLNAHPVKSLICGNNNVLVAGTLGDGINISLDSGSNFINISSPFDSVFSLALDLSNTIYAVTEDFTWKSSNDGLTWNRFDTLISNPKSIIVLQNLVYLGTRDGLYKSTNSGQNWQGIGIRYTNVTHMSVAQNNDLYAMKEGEDNKSSVWRSNDGGSNWSLLLTLPTLGTSLKVTRTGSILVGGFNNIYSSTDNGLTFVSNSTSSPVQDIEEDRNNILYYSVGANILNSTNNGQSWSFYSNNSVGASEIAFDSANLIYAISAGGVLTKSSNNGMNWTNYNVGTIFGKHLAIKDNGTMFVTGSGVWRSTNGGVNWTEVMFNNASGNVVFNNLGHVFAIFAGDPYRSLDNGSTFEEVSTGLLDFEPTMLAISPDQRLYTGTNGFGAFRSRILTDINFANYTIPDKFILNNNFPNPFNPSTNISFSIPNKSYVTLTVYDILGKEVAQIVNGELQAGFYSYIFNSEGLAGGIYFYSLKSGTFSETKKMMLVK